MSPEGIFCSRCGTPAKPGEKFCENCGKAFFAPEKTKDTVAIVKEAADTAAAAARSVESAVSAAESVVNVAGTVAHFTVAPPAQWKVVVGDALPAAGEAIADRAAGAVQAKVEEEVVSGVKNVVQHAIGETSKAGAEGGRSPVSGTTPGPERPATTVPAGPCCPSCGAPVIAGKKFCHVCGKAIVLSPAPPAPAGPVTCPSCGKPLTAGKKFCRFCGRKIG